MVEKRSSLAQGQFSFSMKPLKEVSSSSQEKKKPTRRKSSSRKTQTSLLPISSSEPMCLPPLVMTVSEVTKRVRGLLEKGLGIIWVEGEISNYRQQSSGHHYFTLKDEGSQLACVLFARDALLIPGLLLANGCKVQLYGQMTLYEPRGQYQLLVRFLQHQGIGLLQARFEALKRELAAEGLFDSSRKKRIPRFLKRLAIITSPRGAALADFLKVLYRRQAGVEVVIYPVRVQGEGAAGEIAMAIEELNSSKSIGPLELIVLTRGGGSLEDLWAFNEEIVVRTIAASRLPIVTGVGHEIDHTLSDFAADLEASTPSAAAELISLDSTLLLQEAAAQLNRIARELAHCWEQIKSKKKMLQEMILIRTPERFLMRVSQRLDVLEENLQEQMRSSLERRDFSIKNFMAYLRGHAPTHLLNQAKERCSNYEQRLHRQVAHGQAMTQARFENLRSSLAALSPQATLSRGFTITRHEGGKIIASKEEAAQLPLGSLLKTEFAQGGVLLSTTTL